MSRVTPTQTSFNGGEISGRLRARADQGIYGIAVKEMTGFAPLMEGPAEAMPGTIHVAQAAGPARLLRFEFNATQGHVIEASDGLFRIFTNDALLSVGDAPVEIESPYDWADVQALNTHQSYDVLYCLKRDRKPREFRRDSATTFSFADLVFDNGPFEDRNRDESIRVNASGVSGTVTLTATAPIFAETDVGGLFQMEAEDFGDIRAWEPGIQVANGLLLTYAERVYRVVGLGAASRTGGLAPVHTTGVEWDGTGQGTDINDKPAPGVQLEYLHDKIGILRITGFTSATEVEAEVLRPLPFSSAGVTGIGSYNFFGRYEVDYDYIPGGVSYQYGTWRWRFGAFSDTRGWPHAACVWNERLWLAKDTTIYGSAAGDLKNFAVFNELGELTNDMALTAEIPDPNPILHLVGDERLLILTAKGTFALGPGGAATGVGPNNRRIDVQNNRRAGQAEPVQLDSRTLFIDRSGRRVHECDFDPGRNTEGGIDLTRYARHIGESGLVALAAQELPLNHVWAVRGDGSLACAAYQPEEEVLGWAQRHLPDGMAARSICAISDPEGQFDQIWLLAECSGPGFAGTDDDATVWHVLRMAPWREDGEADPNAVMLDMAAVHDGAPQATFTHPVLRSRTIDVVADGAWRRVEVDAAGAFTLPQAASRVVAGLPFPARITGLPIEAGGDSGPAMGKKARIGRAWLKVQDAQGLAFGVPGAVQAIELLRDGSVMDNGFGFASGFHFIERAGDWTREPCLTVERNGPFQATVLAWGCTLEVEQR